MSKSTKLIIFLAVIGLIGLAFYYTQPSSQDSAAVSEKKEEAPSLKEEGNENNPGSSYKRYQSPPAQTLETDKDYKAVLKTSKGDIAVDLFEKETPVTVNNFVFLSKEGFYDKTRFHRIIKGFMIQGGDPLGNGTGGPGYKFNDEPVTRDYSRGILAMANSGPNTNGSQFFIMHADYQLPKQYVIFGQVVEGIEVVDKIAGVPVVSNGFGESSKPTEEVTVDSVEIL
ncbi:peptidylprolyl isomerase [candidate division WWE3 bacterium]|nr:peptidylprolyl isomerase [candidate division WWE3 bacterium]